MGLIRRRMRTEKRGKSTVSLTNGIAKICRKMVRCAFHAKMRAGQYLGSSCPYGYIKDPKDHNHLIIDEYAAGVVKRIYSLYLQGYGKAKIGRILSDDGILIPTQYKREVLGLNYHNSHELETTKHWTYQTVHMILNNEVYIGNGCAK